MCKEKHFKMLSVLLALLIAISLMSGCSNNQSAPNGDLPDPTETALDDSSIKGYLVETLKLEGGTDWGAPNPYLNASRGPGQAKMRLVYASLLEKDETGDVPWLAESWSIDGNDYSFTLFENTMFHDGAPLTTGDVAFTLDYFSQFPPITNTLGTGESYIIESHKIVDERTIVITVKESLADTLVNLGSSVILPKHIWENIEDPYTYTGVGYLVGSGAYMCTEYDGASGSYEFTAFDQWPNGQQSAERILFIPVSDALLAFQNGEIDITSMPADLMDHYLSDERIGVVNKANDMGYKMLINFEKFPEFLDKDLRVAIYQALNRQAVVDSVFRGAGSIGNPGYVPEGGIYYNPDCIQYDYNPQAAKEVLSEKGISIKLLSADSGNDVAISELIRNDLEAAGISVTVEAYDSATRDDKINSGNYEFAIVGNGGWGNSPPTYMRTLFSDKSKYTGGNPHSMGPRGYSNSKMTEIAEAQMYEVDFETRMQMFKELQYLVSQEIPLFVIANQSSYSMFYKDHYEGWMKTYAYQQAEQTRLSYMAR